MLYEPSPNTGRFTRYILRTSIDPAAILPTIRSRVSAIDPDVPVRDLATVSDMFAQSISQQRFAMTLLVLFAATAVSMAVIGIYGVLSQIVAQRTREIGIRVALGASTARVRNLIVSQALAMTGIGLVIGAGLALISTRLFESQLFGIGSRDAASFGLAAGVILAAASIGALLPAHRATVVDPVEAVRAE
jgi:ABC-type antimicrobial peptide transport system permease subunit